MEPFVPQPKAMASPLLSQPTPQVDRRADPRQSRTPSRGSCSRGILLSYSVSFFSFLIFVFKFPASLGLNLSLLACSMLRSRNSFVRPLSSRRKKRKRSFISSFFRFFFFFSSSDDLGLSDSVFQYYSSICAPLI